MAKKHTEHKGSVPLHHAYATTGKPPGYEHIGKAVKQAYKKGGHVKPRGRG